MAPSLEETQEPGSLDAYPGRGQEGLRACIGLLFLLRSVMKRDEFLDSLMREVLKNMASDQEQAEMDSR